MEQPTEALENCTATVNRISYVRVLSCFANERQCRILLKLSADRVTPNDGFLLLEAEHADSRG